MSKFHSTVTRRDFMKALGLGAAGLGAAAATTPVFHDLDEIIGSDKAVRKLPWYVKEQDKTTNEIDWNLVQRWDAVGTGVWGSYSPEQQAHLMETRPRVTKEHVVANAPGNTLRDLSLWQATNFAAHVPKGEWAPAQFPIMPPPYWTPESLGVPKWQGTPEENLKMMRALVRFLGGSDVTALEFDANTRKLVNRRSGGPGIFGPAPIVYYEFEDVDKAYSTPEKKVIPNRDKYVMVWAVVQSDEMNKRLVQETNTMFNSASVFHAYYRITTIEHMIQRFLYGIGYEGIGASSDCGKGAFAWVSGMGENCRASFTAHPIYGSMIRVPSRMYTDLPLTHTKPIDAGLFTFCKSCQRCGDFCPSGAISTGDPSWEVTGKWNAHGFEGWRVDYGKCYPYRGMPGGEFAADCGMCQGVCVFSKRTEAGIHDIVRATIATTPVFNSFFTVMDKAFGYPDRDVEAWWDEEQPVYGINSYL